MKALRTLPFLIVLMTIGAVATAHHSFAVYDLEKEVTLTGMVKEFHWTNPHVWLEIRVSDGKGTSTNWSFEMGAPGMLTRTGWKSRMLTPGDEVKVVANPLKTGESRGRLVKVILPNGRVMGPGGVAPPPKPRAAAGVAAEVIQ
jgi:hypothetical protein